jgi:fucose 4-O-acetylase-like acetyltransferase
MNLNFLKGLLIVLVIVDHNEFSRSLFPGFLLGMTFHVVGFMTIPFLKPPTALGTRAFAAYAFRLYYPFLLVTCGMWALVTAMGAAPLAGRLEVLGIALYSGNADMLKVATQMGLLWFLPSFISLVVLRNAIGRCGSGWRIAAFALLLAAHLVIGAVAKAIQDYVPMGLLPALYMVPLAYAGAALQRKLFEPMGAGLATVLALAAFAAVKAVQMQMGLDNEVGFSAVADYRHPLALLVNDLEAVCGTLMLFQFSRWNIEGVIAACGKYSMQVYLFHAFIALGIYKALVRFAHQAPPLALFLVSVLLTALLTLLLARLVMRAPALKRLIFPRDPAELLGTKAAAPAPQQS